MLQLRKYVRTCQTNYDVRILYVCMYRGILYYVYVLLLYLYNVPLQNPLLKASTLWPNAPVYTPPQLQPSLYYPSASMIQPPYQQQFQHPTAAQQIADRNMPPIKIPDNSAVLRTTPHQSYIDQTRTKQSKTIKIINPETMKEVDTTPASSAHSTPTESKIIDKPVESKNNKVC